MFLRWQIEVDFHAKVLNPSGNESTFTDNTSVDLPSKHRIALTLEGSDTASSDRDGDGKSSSNDEVTFTLTVNNTGTVDLTDVVVRAGELEGLVCQQFSPSAIGEGYKGFHDIDRLTSIPSNSTERGRKL